MPSQGGRMSHQAAKRIANALLRAHGSCLAAGPAHWDRTHEVWVVAPRDPAHPDEMLIGGALVVIPGGECHEIGSLPDAVDELMMSLGRWPGLRTTA